MPSNVMVMMMLLGAACCPVKVPWSVERVLPPENRHDNMLREPAREVRLEGILRDTK